MIKISVMRQDDEKIIGLSVEGHAGAGVYGQDIVCAAVSALAQSVILGLAKHLHREINYDVKPGYLSVALKDKADDLTEAVFAVAVLGFAEIEKSNPKNVSVLNIRR